MRRQIRARISMIVCAAMLTGMIPGGSPVSEAAHKQIVTEGQPVGESLWEQELPVSDLQAIEAYEEVDGEAVAGVPVYTRENVFYSRSRSVFQDATGDYGYRCLSPDQQELYLAVEAALTEFQSSDEEEFSKVTYGYTPFRVSYDAAVLEKDQLGQMWIAFLRDHPWLYWLSSYSFSKSGSSGAFMPLVTETYEEDINAKREMDRTIEAGIQEYIAAADEAEGTYEKVRTVYDKLIHDINYAYKSDGVTPESDEWAHSVVGVFDGIHNRAVCEGYSEAFALILNVLDIPNVWVSGTAKGGGHAWNAVSFDGGDTYYYMDATWDDRGGKGDVEVENYYVYFAMPRDAFERQHTVDVNGAGMDWQYDMPSLGNDMDYTYFVRYASYAGEGVIRDVSSARDFLKAARVLSPGEKCLLLLPDIDTISKVNSAAGLSGRFQYYPVEEYGMVLYDLQADDFYSGVPAETVALSDSALLVDLDLQPEQKISIQSVTGGSDDYITFFSSDEKVAVVTTPYVKAERGEQIYFTARGAGTAVIYAKSAAGGATASCTVTVKTAQPSSPEPTEGAEASEKPEISASPSPSPISSEVPEISASPSPISSEIPGISASPNPISSEVPGASSSKFPSMSDSPNANPSGAGPNGGLSLNPSPTPAVLPPAASEGELKKGDIFLAGDLKYKVKKINGRRGELGVTGIRTKNKRSIVIPNKVTRGGISFAVTAIQKNAFRGCKKTVLLTIKSTSIKTIAKKALSGLNKKVKIKLPKGKAKAYRKLIKKSGVK